MEIARVELGQDDGTQAVIRRGLEEGVRVVVGGQSRLRAGARVTINAPGSAPPGAAPNAQPSAQPGTAPTAPRPSG